MKEIEAIQMRKWIKELKTYGLLFYQSVNMLE